MATNETTYVIRAKTEDFDKVGAEVSKLGEKLKKSQGSDTLLGAASGKDFAEFAKAIREKINSLKQLYDAQKTGEEGVSRIIKRASQERLLGLEHLVAKLRQVRDELHRVAAAANAGGGGGGGGGGPIFAGGGGIVSGGGGGVIGGGGTGLPPAPIPGLSTGSSGGGGIGLPPAPIPGLNVGGGGGGGIGLPPAPIPGLNVPEYQQSSGSFRQGLLQSMLPESFIQRGPGMYRQAAGVFVGRGVRGLANAAGSLLTAPITGSSALVSAAGNLPYGLSVLASPMQQAVQAGHQEIEMRRQMQGSLPFVSDAGGDALSKFNRARMTATGIGRQMGLTGNEAFGMLAQGASGTGALLNRYSVTAQQQALQAGAFGIDAGSAFGLARGEQRGTATSGQAGVSLLARAIANATTEGLEGSDLVDYVRRMTGYLEDFDQTGIKVDGRSLGGVDNTVSALTGATGRRAQAQSEGFMNMVRGMVEGGPQGPEQLAMFRRAGFRPGDANSYYEAQRTIQDPTKLPDILLGTMQDMRARSANLGINQRAAMQRRTLARLGINQDPTMAYKMAQGPLPNRAQLARMMGITDQVAAGTGSMMGTAAEGVVAESTLSTVDQANRLSVAGQKMVGVNRALDSATIVLTEKMADAGGAIYKLGTEAIAAGNKMMRTFAPTASPKLKPKT